MSFYQPPQSNITIFDRKKIKQQRIRAAHKLEDHGFLVDWSRDQLLSRLEIIKKDFTDVLQLGTRTSIDKKIIKGCSHFYQMDIAPQLLQDKKNTLIADEEFLPFNKEVFDLIISPLNLHTTNDLTGTLIQLKLSLKPDGLLLAAMLGGETLYELRDVMNKAEMDIFGGISPRVAPFADMPQMGSLMQRANYNLPVIDSEIVTVTYENIYKLMHDLRYMGEGNALHERSRRMGNKKLMARASELYKDLYSEDDGRIRATFEIIFLIGWAPHETQQKPLRPGSAQTRLADALGTEEISTTDKATP